MINYSWDWINHQTNKFAKNTKKKLGKIKKQRKNQNKEKCKNGKKWKHSKKILEDTVDTTLRWEKKNLI